MIIVKNNQPAFEATIEDSENNLKNFEDALKANLKDAEEIAKGHGEDAKKKKVTNPELKKMHLSESLFEDYESFNQQYPVLDDVHTMLVNFLLDNGYETYDNDSQPYDRDDYGAYIGTTVYKVEDIDELKQLLKDQFRDFEIDLYRDDTMPIGEYNVNLIGLYDNFNESLTITEGLKKFRKSRLNG